METLKDYDFLLPEELIATTALPNREDSRLLRFGNDTKAPIDDRFSELGRYLSAGDVLVVNNTQVMKARINAFKKSGGRVQVLLVRPLENGHWAALMNGRGPFLPGTKLNISDDELVVIRKIPDEPGLYEIASNVDLEHYAHAHGQIPLPPYFGRDAEAIDEIRYQTIFARKERWSAVAAPTAGLHFTPELVEKLKAQGIRFVESTLHVGPGTFLPIRTDNIADHRMHSEWFSLSHESAQTLNEAKAQGKRVIAVGTTALRVLEQTMQWAHEKDSKEFFACSGTTALFIRPGFKFLGADGIITNFHVPRSTLMVLIAAVLGLKRALSCYEHAIKERYRFFSYGDACFFDMADAHHE